MRIPRLSILIPLLLLIGLETRAQDAVPSPASDRFPNIRASLADGFFVLAEQQARGILRAAPTEADERETLLLLSHALWGQKRYTELLDTLQPYDGEPGFVYWRARAHYELRQYDEAVKILDQAGETMEASRYAPSALRLRGHVEQLLGNLAEAEASYRLFAEAYPDHERRVANQFDLAETLSRQQRITEALAIYEALAAEKNVGTAQRAQLKRAHLLHTQGSAAGTESARILLAGLATNEQTRLAYRIDAWVDLAALEEAAARPQEAAAALGRAIALSPDARQRVPLKLALARLALREGDSASALKLLEECRAEAPNETVAAELQLEKAKALLQAKRFKEADDAFQIYLDVATDAVGLSDAYYGKGLAMGELGRFAEAATALDKAAKGLRLLADRADALFKAGDAYYQAGKYDEAEKRYRTFAAELPEHDNTPNALYQAGLSAARAGRRTDALATFQGIEQTHPKSPFAEKAALRSADVMLAGEQWDAALEKYTQIGLTYTNGVVAALSTHQRGIVLHQLGRFPEAQAAFEAVVATWPESEYAPQAFYMRGFCLYRQGQIEEAVATCKAFVEKYPGSEWTPEVLFWLAEQYFNQGRYADAEPLFLRIAAEFKPHWLAPRALYWAGRCAAAESNYVKAVERYGEVAKNHPGSEIMPQVRFAQGDALTELGEFARAVLAFEEIIKNYPDSPLVNAAWGRKGDCQFSLASDAPERYAEAITSFQAILDRPSAPRTLKLQAEYKIGRCLEKSGSADRAFSRYMNVVYTFINENIERSPYSVMWFTRSAFGAATLKEMEKAWLEAAKVYERVLEANVPAKDEALKRLQKIKKDNWLLFQQAEETDYVGTDG